MSKEIFIVYHCKACNKIEVSQYVTKEEMEELRQFSFTDVEGIKEYLNGRCVLLS